MNKNKFPVTIFAFTLIALSFTYVHLMGELVRVSYNLADVQNTCRGYEDEVTRLTIENTLLQEKVLLQENVLLHDILAELSSK